MEQNQERKFEARRQLFHILLGLSIVVFINYNILNRITMPIIIIAGFLISHYSKKSSIPVISWFLLKFERKTHLRTFPGRGVIFYFLGAFIVLLLFDDRNIALASIMILAFGDSVSHIFGIHFGKTPHPLSGKKFIEGGIAGFFAGLLGAMVFVNFQEAALAAFAAMAAEAIDVKIGIEQVDDNLIIPVVAGATIWALRILT